MPTRPTTLAQVRVALADVIGYVAGTPASPYLVDSFTTPSFQLWAAEYDPRMVFDRAKVTVPFRARVFVGRTAEIDAQKLVDLYRDPDGPRSIVAAVEDEDNWPADLIDTAYVTLVGEPAVATIADHEYLTCDFEIEVIF